jgi:hypothetical protein
MGTAGKECREEKGQSEARKEWQKTKQQELAP